MNFMNRAEMKMYSPPYALTAGKSAQCGARNRRREPSAMQASEAVSVSRSALFLAL